ncbi:sensor histidine kinase [Dongia rigui]|uniref:histidine kinase n=1 Tax=Dongia rigui TaxID=940149 RepID=A0ABU5E2D7_9PROT|nr:ATP-binding protein [Dongia rigui]MDY0873365.1 ATP-binding protein [Dongia rigui]
MLGRIRWWLGGRLSRQLIAALAISVFLIGAPAGLLLYSFSDRSAIEDAKRIVLSIQESKQHEIEAALAMADPSLSKLQGYIATALQPPASHADQIALKRMVIPFIDGSLRPDPKTFDGRQHAGMYLDPRTPRTDAVAAFHSRLAPIIDLYGAGTIPRFDTLWLLTRWHSMIVLMPRVPTYVWDATPDDDYNATEWMTGADPVVNPQRKLYWTKPAYDPISRSWMVSAVKPLDVGGDWVGTIGHDFFLAGLFDRLSANASFADSEDFLIDGGGDYMLAGKWQNAIESAAFVASDKAEIDDALRPVQDSLRKTIAPHIALTEFRGEPVLATATRIAGPNWTLIHIVPLNSIAGRISDAFVGSLIVTLIAFLMVAVAIHWLLQQRVIQPLRLLANSVQRFEDGENAARAAICRNDEIGRLAGAFNTMATRIGKSRVKLEKARQELESRNVELQRANRAKTNALANMSHEFRTPLNAILGFSEILNMQLYGALGDKRYVEYVGHIHHSGKHLLELINDILDLSKIEAEKMTLKCDDHELQPLIESCLAMVKPAADTRGVALLAPRDGETAVLNCDRRAVNQMLLNLLSNAIRHTPAGGTVSVSIDPAPQGGLALTVSDTGSGIPDRLLPLLFSPFGIRSAHIAQNASAGRGGTGLGLSITRGLIRLHEGDVTVETKVGKGTRMRLIFPPQRVRQPEPAPLGADALIH